MQCAVKNMGKTPEKNQHGKFHHTNILFLAMFLQIFLRMQSLNTVMGLIYSTYNLVCLDQIVSFLVFIR